MRGIQTDILSLKFVIIFASSEDRESLECLMRGRFVTPLFGIGKRLTQKHSPLVMIVMVLSECPKDKINICAVTNSQFHGDPLCDSAITRENANELYSIRFAFIVKSGKLFSQILHSSCVSQRDIVQKLMFSLIL